MTGTKEVYLFHRDGFEKNRLNKQHDLLVSLCNDQLLHPRIPKDAIRRVADIGTGSGIWLENVRQTLLDSSMPVEREYAGFDISAAHFPAQDAHPALRTRYIVHDILQPFPDKHHGSYDVVHVRLMVLALKKNEIRVAAANVAALLKTGGYFQWEEIETRNMSFDPPSETTTRVRDIMRASSAASGLTNAPAVEIEHAFTTLGLADVVVEDYSSSHNSRPELMGAVREWSKAGARAGLPYAVLRGQTAKNKDEAGRMAAGLLEAYNADIDGGIVPSLPLRMILGRKA